MNNEEQAIPVVDINEFGIDKQYQHYLEKVELSEALMHPVQRQETKRAFVGGMAQMLLIFLNDLPRFTDDNDVDIIIGTISNQIGAFFTAEAEKPLIILP